MACTIERPSPLPSPELPSDDGSVRRGVPYRSRRIRAIIVDCQCHPLGVILGAHVDLTVLGRLPQDVVEEVLRHDAEQLVTVVDRVVADA